MSQNVTYQYMHLYGKKKRVATCDQDIPNSCIHTMLGGTPWLQCRPRRAKQRRKKVDALVVVGAQGSYGTSKRSYCHIVYVFIFHMLFKLLKYGCYNGWFVLLMGQMHGPFSVFHLFISWWLKFKKPKVKLLDTCLYRIILQMIMIIHK
jgi:hypothetical protein